MSKFPQQTVHPWHGVNPGTLSDGSITAYIEIVPSDTVKYELDKESGLLKIDRPQLFSNICPMPYGFIPRTYCGNNIAELCMKSSGRTDIIGDGDPLDICILTEKIIPHGNILMQVIPIGGLRMIDNNEADDKIIAVLKDDAVYGHLKDLKDCPDSLVQRLKHYFLTYKLKPGESASKVQIAEVYNFDTAHMTIDAAKHDYQILTGDIAANK